MTVIDRVITIPIARVKNNTSTMLEWEIPLFLGESLVTFPEIVKSYTSLEAVLADFTDVMPEYLAAKAFFSQSPRVPSMLIGQKLAAPTLLDAYTLVKVNNPDFYAVTIESEVSADILAIAGAVEAERRIFGVNSSQVGILSGTVGNDFELLFDLGYERAFGIWGELTATQLPACAWLGKQLAKIPGSSNWKYQSLSGVTGDQLFESAELQVAAYNATYYTFFASKNVTIGGKMFSGEWIDAIHGIDWITTSLEIALASLLVDVEKVPYTTRGDGLIDTAIRSVLKLASDNNVINDDFSVDFTIDIANVPLADRTARIRKGIEVFFTLTGAINEMNIKVVVSD